MLSVGWLVGWTGDTPTVCFAYIHRVFVIDTKQTKNQASIHKKISEQTNNQASMHKRTIEQTTVKQAHTICTSKQSGKQANKLQMQTSKQSDEEAEQRSTQAHKQTSKKTNTASKRTNEQTNTSEQT